MAATQDRKHISRQSRAASRDSSLTRGSNEDLNDEVNRLSVRVVGGDELAPDRRGAGAGAGDEALVLVLVVQAGSGEEDDGDKDEDEVGEEDRSR